MKLTEEQQFDAANTIAKTVDKLIPEGWGAFFIIWNKENPKFASVCVKPSDKDETEQVAVIMRDWIENRSEFDHFRAGKKYEN